MTKDDYGGLHLTVQLAALMGWLRDDCGMSEVEAIDSALLLINKSPPPRPPKTPEPPLDDLDELLAGVRALCEEVAE